MMDRYANMLKALEIKPKMGQPCNNCGWCCLTETCPTGLVFTPADAKVCAMLEQKDDKYFCKLATSPMMREMLGMGQGCDARSIEEQLQELVA